MLEYFHALEALCEVLIEAVVELCLVLCDGEIVLELFPLFEEDTGVDFELVLVLEGEAGVVFVLVSVLDGDEGGIPELLGGGDEALELLEEEGGVLELLEGGIADVFVLVSVL